MCGKFLCLTVAGSCKPFLLLSELALLHYLQKNIIIIGRTGPNLLSTKAVYYGVEFQESRRKWRTKNLWPPAEGGAMSKSTAGGKSKRYLWHGSDNLHISFQSAHSIPTFIKPMQFHLPILGISPVGHYNCCFYCCFYINDNFVSNQNYFYSRNKFSWLYFISNKIYFLLLFFLSFILNFSNFKFTIYDLWFRLNFNSPELR